MPGAFIVVEGPDGAGKTTLAAALARRLREQGITVREVREPGGTPLAERAREAVLDPGLAASPEAELFLMLAARADLVAKVIRPALEAGAWVVSDRFDLSTEAYQIAGRGLPREAALNANWLATKGLAPQLTVVLDVPAATGQARRAGAGKAADRIEGDHLSLHQRVARAFREAGGPTVVHLDGTLAAAEVEAAAWAAVRQRVGELFPRRQG
ncbi:MAG TPA: dTMP kinase [Gemmatimonadales bacterium]|nr:dTMP kinase [Gemmatimonadales bacterium]